MATLQKLELEVPEEILVSLKESSQEFSKDLLMLAAVKLYELGKLSSGRAAQLAGISRVSFLQSLSRYNVSIFDLTEEELKQDLANA
jgi:predicted HTH domain antitoxin